MRRAMSDVLIRNMLGKIGTNEETGHKPAMQGIYRFLAETELGSNMTPLNHRWNCISIELDNEYILRIFAHPNPDEFHSFCVLCVDDTGEALMVKAKRFSDFEELIRNVAFISSYSFYVTRFDGDLPIDLNESAEHAEILRRMAERLGGYYTFTVGINVAELTLKNRSKFSIFVRGGARDLHFVCIVAMFAGTMCFRGVQIELESVFEMIENVDLFTSIPWSFGPDADYCMYSATPIPDPMGLLDAAD